MSPELGNIIGKLISAAAETGKPIEKLNPEAVSMAQQSVLSALKEVGLDKVDLSVSQVVSAIEEEKERNSVRIVRAVLFETEDEGRYSNLFLARKLYPQERDHRLTSNRVGRAKNAFAAKLTQVAQKFGEDLEGVKVSVVMEELLKKQEFTGKIGDEWGELYQQINETFPDLQIGSFIRLFIGKTR